MLSFALCSAPILQRSTLFPYTTLFRSALGMAMTHVVLKEYYVDQMTPYFNDYVKKYTDLPFLITLNQDGGNLRSEEHTSELQSRGHIVCRLLLEKKKITTR